MVTKLQEPKEPRTENRKNRPELNRRTERPPLVLQEVDSGKKKLIVVKKPEFEASCLFLKVGLAKFHSYK